MTKWELATISKLRTLIQKIEGSIQFKFALTYVAIIRCSDNLNTYPIVTARTWCLNRSGLY